MTQISDFCTWFRDTVEPENYAMADPTRGLAAHEARYQAAKGVRGQGLGRCGG